MTVPEFPSTADNKVIPGDINENQHVVPRRASRHPIVTTSWKTVASVSEVRQIRALTTLSFNVLQRSKTSAYLGL